MAFNFEVRQLNCHRSRQVLTSLHDETIPGQYIWLLQEPYLHRQNVCGLDKTRLYYTRDVDTRTAIYTSPGIRLTLCSNLSGRDCTTCSFELNGQKTFISSVYLDILATVEEPNWLKTLTKARSSNCPLIAGLDANAHSPLWGSPSANPRGLAVEDLLYANGLSLLNTGNKPTFETQAGSSIIDLTVVSPALASRVTRWRVHEEMHLSDHHMISCSVELAPQRLPVRKGRKLKRVNWTHFKNIVETEFATYEEPLLWSAETIEASTTFLQKSIITALDKEAPLVTFRPKEQDFTWWNSDLSALKKAAQHAHRAARKAPKTPEKWAFFHSSLRQFKYANAKARKQSWRSFTSEAQSMPLAAKLNRIMRNQTYRQLGALQRPDGSFTDSTTESYKVLMSEHFPGAVAVDGRVDPVDPIPMPARGPHPELVDQPEWIDERRLREALVSFGNIKAPGPDGIKPIVLKHLPEVAEKALARIYAAMIQLHYTPALWRKSEIVFIPKPGKSDYSNPRAYRPIALMSFFFKALERLVQWRMDDTASPYHRNQHAFRTGHCTEHALSQMTDTIERGLFKGWVVLAVYLDIQGAFDTLSSPAIARGMRNHGVEPDLTSWFTQYLQHRVCSVKGLPQPFLVQQGTGQGGVLSSSVWNFTMDSFLKEFDTGQVKAIGYADDGALIVVCQRLHTARKLMNQALRKAYFWAFRNGLTFSAAKTTAVIYSEYESQLDRPLKLGNAIVEVKDEVTYLGVLFDYRLSWTPHILRKVQAAKKHLMLLRQVVGPTWGPPPHIAKWLYTAVVRPALTYGALVWAQHTRRITIQNALQKAQRLALVMLAPMRLKSPTKGLELVAGVLPLHLCIQELAVSTYNRIGRPPELWTGKKDQRLGHLLWLEKMARPVPHRDFQDRCVEHVWTRHFTVSIGDGDDEPELRGLKCYTDGSLMAQAGSGFAIYRSGTTEPIVTESAFAGEATVFQAELHAITLACTAAQALPDTRITLFSDSQAAILAINKSTIQSRTVLRAVQALHALGHLKIVHLQWIKGHNGSTGNELADHLAKLGSRQVIEGPGPWLPMARAQVKAITVVL